MAAAPAMSSTTGKGPRLLRLALLLLAARPATACFWPDGSSDNGSYVMCTPHSAVCCQPGDACLNQPMCRRDDSDGSKPFYYRPNCRDGQWGDQCDNLCLNIPGATDSSLQIIGECNRPGFFFCDGANHDCDRQLGVFSLALPLTIATAPASVPTPSSATTSKSVGGTSPSSRPTAASPTKSRSQPTQSPTPSQPAAGNKGGRKNVAAIVAGAVIGAVALSAAGVAVFVLMRRRRRRITSVVEILPPGGVTRGISRRLGYDEGPAPDAATVGATAVDGPRMMTLQEALTDKAGR